ncbi:GLPGLI family protein [Capnocytophaga sp. ARDL2]|uniref:GLPGLI family protein n=1 Tax=Capnocytophaga sp. ARDL2 TaxID=3238809 RepID=UPI0035564C3C
MSVNITGSTRFQKTSLSNNVQFKDGAFYVSIDTSDEKGYVICRNFNEKSMLLRNTKYPVHPPHVVIENWLEIKWKLTDKYKEIESLTCRKAIGEFNGRTYEAWYAIDLPISIGPWKLFGLPGIIL